MKAAHVVFAPHGKIRGFQSLKIVISYKSKKHEKAEDKNQGCYGGY